MTESCDIFIVGSKGIPAHYGGFETFVEHLTAERKDLGIKYHVSCMNDGGGSFFYNDAECFNVALPLPGPAGRIFHVDKALSEVEFCIKERGLKRTVVLILGCRIGPFMRRHAASLHKLGATVVVNPDGLEWKRDKWNALLKRFLKYCEKSLVLNADLVVCDSKSMQDYICDKYWFDREKTEYIAYGANAACEPLDQKTLNDWFRLNDVAAGSYYLVVGRFVPENNYEAIIRGFKQSETEKTLVIVTNHANTRFYSKLDDSTSFSDDERIKFVGTVYDQRLLRGIRENAFAYIHGHSVGGTNPSLLEAMATTSLNLLFDVKFNREVAEGSALYWGSSQDLTRIMRQCEQMDVGQRDRYSEASKARIREAFTWDGVINQYETLFQRIAR